MNVPKRPPKKAGFIFCGACNAVYSDPYEAMDCFNRNETFASFYDLQIMFCVECFTVSYVRI